MSKYKNVGKNLRENKDGKGSKNPKNLMRYMDKAKRTTKSNLTKGAFGG